MGLFDPNRSNQPPQRPSGRSIWGRLLLGIIIALIGWFMYSSQTEVNPVTGKKQHVTLSPSDEVKLGLESAPKMAREMGGLASTSDPRTQEVEKIGNFLVSSSKAKNSPWKFRFHLLADTKTVNAFALPGGQIFITMGLYDKLQNEAQLAGVLGHEMGHVIERHTAQQMAKSQLGQWLIMAVGSAAADPDNYGSNNNATIIASVVNQMFQLKYSREDESQADEWGLLIMEDAGFNPEAMIEVMKVLKAASGGKGGDVPDFFQTHPNPDLRMEQIKEYLKKHPPKPGLSNGQSLKHSQTDDYFK